MHNYMQSKLSEIQQNNYNYGSLYEQQKKRHKINYSTL